MTDQVATNVKDYLKILTDKIIKETGKKEDEYHIGKMIFQSLKDDPDFLLQIDAATNETETSGSVLDRSVRCALGFLRHGLKAGDVIIVMGPNNIHQCIPFYAALFIGVAVYGVDRLLRINELKSTFEPARPKMVFCAKEKAAEVKGALDKINLKAHVVIYDNDNDENYMKFEDLLKNNDEKDVQSFRPLDIDPDTTTALLLATSGSTGLPKCTICTHKQFAIGARNWFPTLTKFPKPMKMSMLVSPIQWLTASNTYIMSSILKYTRLMTSDTIARESVYHMINTYKPTYILMSPTFAATLLNPAERNNCDFSSFKLILLGGSFVSKSLLQELKEVSPDAKVFSIYGLSELAGCCNHPVQEPVGSIGIPVETVETRLIDVVTGEDIKGPNKPGELWVKGPSLFKGYYNNEQATTESFTEDGWFKTGDILYRDENNCTFFVERLKLLLKYKNNQISPGEIEELIMTHPGVLDTAVAGIPHKDDGDLPVAFVVKKTDHQVNAEDIKNLVKDTLSDPKQLRGGVVFIDAIPLTSGGKVDKQKIRQMAAQLAS